jgi:hypothetical protein
MIEDIPQRKQQRVPPKLENVHQFVDDQFNVGSRQRFRTPMVLVEVDAIPQRQSSQPPPADKPGERYALTQPKPDAIDVVERKVFDDVSFEALRQDDSGHLKE